MAGLPLYLNFGGLLAVHASWHKDLVQALEDHANSHKVSFGEGVEGVVVGDDFWIESSKERSAANKIVEALLKGYEADMPEGVTYKDKGGTERDQFRVKWWCKRSSFSVDSTADPLDCTSRI